MTSLLLLPLEPSAYAEDAPAWAATPVEFKLRRGENAPPGFHTETRPRYGWIAFGSVDFAFVYALGASVAASDHFDNQKGWLLLPVLGPWATLLTRDSPCNGGGTDSSGRCCTEPGCPGSMAGELLVIDGIFQAALAAGVASMLINPPRWAVPDGQVTARVLPYVGRDAAGLQLAAQF